MKIPTQPLEWINMAPNRHQFGGNKIPIPDRFFNPQSNAPRYPQMQSAPRPPRSPPPSRFSPMRNHNNTRQARTTTPVTPRATAARTVKKTTTPMTPWTNSFFLFIDVNSDHYCNTQQLLLISKSWSQSKLAFMLIPWHSHYYDGSWGPHTMLDPLRIHVTINLSLAD